MLLRDPPEVEQFAKRGDPHEPMALCGLGTVQPIRGSMRYR